MTIDERLSALRSQMSQDRIDAYIIPSSDPHQSEYVADAWKYREWISGFTGSAGTVVVTMNHAGLWTDSRYFIQAESELAASEFEMHKSGLPETLPPTAWLMEELDEGMRLGANPWMHSMSSWRKMHKQCDEWDIELVATEDMIAAIWVDRPALPKALVFEHDVVYAGLSRTEKLEQLREKMREEEADLYLLTTLDDIAWLLNLRGSDVACNPVTIAYAMVSLSETTLFIATEKMPADLLFELEEQAVFVKPYEDLIPQLNYLTEDETIWVDGLTLSKALFDAITNAFVYRGENVVMHMKAIKNEVEVANIRKAMIKDGIALTRFFIWLEKNLDTRTVSESEAGTRLAAFRAEQPNYYGESFFAIVGYAGNGAIVHYRPVEGKDAEIRKEGILLLDSGGQYYEGTTDITRTLALSTPTADQKLQYTLVLKGHIALARAIFPEDTTGMQLDAFARQYLWQHGLNFGHGTGHGVGAFLNVHEPPQGFAPQLSQRGKTGFKAGMFSSNEPGYYEPGSHGIRIENLILSVQHEAPGNEPFLSFETLTFFPIDTQLIDQSLLTSEERDWLNAYHREVYQQLSPQLVEAEQDWLQQKCTSI